MSITRWDPFRDMLSLREAMNQLLEESYIRPSTMGGAPRGGPQSLALDVTEQGDAYLLRASLPGVRPEDVHVTVLGDTLTIRAETKGEEERQAGNYLLRERHAGVVQRSVTLPDQIDSDAVEADYENGVLTLRLPKSRASMPRRIQVRSGASGGGQPVLEGQMAGQGGGAAGSAGGQNETLNLTAQQRAELERNASLEAQTPGLDEAQRQQMAQEAQAYFEQGPNERDITLERQTPGLDERLVEQTRQDAAAYFSREGGQQDQGQGQAPGQEQGQGAAQGSGTGTPNPS